MLRLSAEIVSALVESASHFVVDLTTGDRLGRRFCWVGMQAAVAALSTLLR